MSSLSSKLVPYSRPTSPIRSVLFKGPPPDAVPATEELEALHEELKQLKARTLERAKKAGEDLKTIEESMRRMKEREKGKAKLVNVEKDKVKRERDYTPLPDGEDLKVHIKPRLSSQPVSSMPPPASARSSLHPRSEESKKKKKKRKREEDGDTEPDAQRPRKATPPAPHTHPQKAQKSNSVSTSQPPSKSSGGPDFSVPPMVSLVPPRPPVGPLPQPGPSKPTDVMEDFTKRPSTQQVLVTTFYTSIEPYLRPIREEDIGFLEHTGDEVEPYVMPPLGRHYLEVWDEQDALAHGAVLAAGAGTERAAPPEYFAPPAPKWDPSTLGEPDLLTEDHGHGQLTERVLSAMLPVGDGSNWKGVKAAEDAMEGRPGGSAAAAARKERLNVTDLEARIRDTMRYHGLLDSPPDYTEKVDDPIATALRLAQRELRTVVATNKARKARLVAIARDRLAYQEYMELCDSIDRNITTTYSRLQKKESGPKALAKKKKKLGGDASAAGTPVPGEAGANGGSVPPPVPPPPPCPAALGLGPDEDNRLVVPEQLQQFVETRRQWVDTVRPVFEEKQRERPGSIWGFPETSVYAGVDEEVRKMLLQPDVHPPAERPLNKGKGKAKDKDPERGDAMDVG